MKGRELPAKRQFFEIFLEKFRGRCKPRLILSKRSLLHGGSLLKPPFLLVLERHSYERIETGGLECLLKPPPDKNVN